MSEDRVVQLAAEARRRYWQEPADEGAGDRQAAEVTRAWQESVIDELGGHFQAERCVADRTERIDLVDSRAGIAYELKVSGNNPHHEFYRDVFKVWMHNQSGSQPIRRLAFITEQQAAERLGRGLAGTVAQRAPLGFSIAIRGI